MEEEKEKYTRDNFTESKLRPVWTIDEGNGNLIISAREKVLCAYYPFDSAKWPSVEKTRLFFLTLSGLWRITHGWFNIIDRKRIKKRIDLLRNQIDGMEQRQSNDTLQTVYCSQAIRNELIEVWEDIEIMLIISGLLRTTRNLNLKERMEEIGK
jgi:hypothetical protein